MLIARGAIARTLDALVLWSVSFVHSFFDHRQIRGVDFGLMVISAGWVWAITFNPEVMGRLALVGVSFLTQQAMVGLFAGLAICHLVAYLQPEARTFRSLVLWFGGSVWLLIGSFMARAVTTGGPTYLVVGFVAWISVIHLYRQRT
ncbi:hypothetical protein [Methylopila sp. M107]|uniref:hypothetical protein n=1 Tax=Methylopila sp. M107 TaxID=1101190 RepID=UPI0003A3D7EB|nr:hypothetical protein [Methylopila sp. M107]